MSLDEAEVAFVRRVPDELTAASDAPAVRRRPTLTPTGGQLRGRP